MRLEDLPDDDDWCAWCGAELPVDRRYGLRRFCTESCRKAAHYSLQREARQQARAGRTCDHCGTSIPEHVHGQQRFCSHGCKVQWWSDYHGRRLRAGRTDRRCGECGGPMPVDLQANAKWCSARCGRRVNARRKRLKQAL